METSEQGRRVLEMEWSFAPSADDVRGIPSSRDAGTLLWWMIDQVGLGGRLDMPIRDIAEGAFRPDAFDNTPTEALTGWTREAMRELIDLRMVQREDRPGKTSVYTLMTQDNWKWRNGRRQF